MTLRRGDTHTITGRVMTTASVAVDITGWMIWFTLKRKWTDADGSAVLMKTTGGSGITITDATNGRFEIAIAATDLSGITGAERTEFLYDLQIKNTSNEIQTLAAGRLIVLGDVTGATS